MNTVDFTNIKYGTNATMPKIGCAASFKIETLDQVGICRCVERRRLQRDKPIQLRVVSKIDGAHGSGSQLLLHTVTTEQLWQWDDGILSR